VYHVHRARLSLQNLRLGWLRFSVASDKIVFSLGDATSNIWMAKFQERIYELILEDDSDPEPIRVDKRATRFSLPTHYSSLATSHPL
jgi:hypothetical protein